MAGELTKPAVTAGPVRGISARALAWSIAAAAWVLALVYLGLLYVYGTLQPVHLSYVTAIGTAAAGAMIASRHPENRLGWLMLLFSFAQTLSTVPYDYGYSAVASAHGAWPAGVFVLWVGSWAWILPFGIATGMIGLRFPDGRPPDGWRFVDWLLIAGTTLFVVAVAFMPGPLYPSNLVANPFGMSWARAELVVAFGVGVALIAAGDLGSLASMVARYRRAPADERQQLKYILLAFALVVIALALGVAGMAVFHLELAAALTPFGFALLAMPVAIALAIHRYRLYEIDVFINRTVVYATLTAVLGGLYVAVVELFQRLFVLYTGQKSDTAIVITAFVVAAAFTPVQKWIEGVAERRLGSHDAASRLIALSANVESIIRVIDPHRIARWLVEESVRAFDAEGGALYLEAHDSVKPFHVAGHLTGRPALEVAVRHEQVKLGRLLLGHRRKSDYSERDRAAIQRSADVLGEALTVADEMSRFPAGESAKAVAN